MASFEGAAAGAGTGSAGGPWGMLAGAILGGLFGGRQKLSPEQKFNMNIAKQLRTFAGSAPMSDPLERMMLAQQKGMLGQEQLQAFQMMQPGAGGQYFTGDAAAQMAGMQSNFVAQRSALDAQALMDALQQRRQALLQAADVAHGVGPRQEQGGGMGQMLGNLAQLYTQYQMSRQKPPQQATGTPYMGTMVTPPAGQGPWGGMQPPFPNAGGMNTASTMSGPNTGQNVPMQAPQGAGYGIPTGNQTWQPNTLNLNSTFGPPQSPYGMPQFPRATMERTTQEQYPWMQYLMGSGAR